MSLFEYSQAVTGSVLTAIAVSIAVYKFTPVWDRIAIKVAGERVESCIRLGYDAETMRLAFRAWGIAFAGNIVVIGCIFNMFPISLALGWLLYVAPKYVCDLLISRRRTLLRDQMVSACNTMASAVKANLSLAKGLETVANNCPSPIADEFKRIVWYFGKRVPLRQAIEHAKRRLGLDAFTLFANAVQVTIDRGSPLNRALDRICHSLQENQRIERRVLSETGAGLRIVLMLAALPPLFLVGMAMLTPEEVGMLFAHFVGQCIIAIAIMVEYFGLRIAIGLLRIDG